MIRSLLLIFACCLASCTYHDLSKATPANNGITPVPQDTSWTATYDVHSLTTTSIFEPGLIIGSIDNASLDEVSGIAASGRVPAALWMEEDSGNPSVVSLLTTAGKYLGNINIAGVTNRDWEDMAVAPGPVDGTPYIYLADIGDNDQKYPTKYIYRFPEPALSIGSSAFQTSISAFDMIAFSFPDGVKNAEAIIVDPLTKDIYVISKETGKAVIYMAPYPQNTTKSFTLEKVGTLPFTKVTSAAISPDGTEVVIKTYTQVFYWKRSLQQSISSLLRQQPSLLPYTIEDQGEAICFAPDGSGFYTTSEMTTSTLPPIYFYRRK
ncbi:hypothetical protein WSM22_35600 [Cytophagales bacterium WSM2-2]|nr:hypothetical protein WSM22_35600 [Cytophagales bacterium WSM2-2]